MDYVNEFKNETDSPKLTTEARESEGQNSIHSEDSTSTDHAPFSFELDLGFTRPMRKDFTYAAAAPQFFDPPAFIPRALYEVESLPVRRGR